MLWGTAYVTNDPTSQTRSGDSLDRAGKAVRRLRMARTDKQQTHRTVQFEETA